MKRIAKTVTATAVTGLLLVSMAGTVWAGNSTNGNGRYGYAGSNVSTEQIGLAREIESVPTLSLETERSWDAQSMDLKTMLTLAIEDEYHAYAAYDAIIDAYGAINPFSNIIEAEQTHIQELNTLFAAYGYSLPSSSAVNISAPTSLEEALALGIRAEIDNIAMYDAFLATDLPDDVRATFEELRSASVHHLGSLQRRLDRYETAPLQTQDWSRTTPMQDQSGFGYSVENGRGMAGSALRVMDPDDENCFR